MHRIDNGTQASSLPTMADAGTPGYFQHGVSGVSTIVDQDWANSQQEEPISVVLAAGVSLVKGTLTQLLRAIRRISGAFCTVITSSTTLTADNLGRIVVDASSGAVVLTLPAANCMSAGLPARLSVYRKDATSANSVTVALAGSDAFTGSAATSIQIDPGETCNLWSDGAASWKGVGSLHADTPAANDNSTRIATTAWLYACMSYVAVAAGFNYSLTIPGFFRLPSWLGGFMVAWGTGTNTSSGVAQGITFYTPFPNSCFGVVACEGAGNNGTWGQGSPSVHAVSNFDTAGFQEWKLQWVGNGWMGGSPISYNYLAVGR